MDFWSKFSSRIYVIAAFAAAHASGLPPKVAAWSPGLNVPATSLFAITAPIGNPPAMAFAKVLISGVTLNVCDANISPVRPNPVCTSSNIRRTSLSWHNSFRSFK